MLLEEGALKFKAPSFNGATPTMRNIFVFIRRYFTFLCFLFLQGISLYLLFSYNKYHQAKGIGIANQISGWFNTRYKNVNDFFHLKAENHRLLTLNDSLLNLLPSNYLAVDSTSKIVQDSIVNEQAGQKLRYRWRPAKVVYTTVREQKNYIQINKGSNAGIKENMAVVNSDGSLVGIIVNTSANFSQAMSLLHVQLRVSAELKNSGEYGTIIWDGKDAQRLTLKDIPGSAKVNVGDTILTSRISYNYPPGVMIGTVSEIINDESTNFYVLKIKPTANLYNLQQVEVIENLFYEEQKTLNEQTKQKMDERKQR